MAGPCSAVSALSGTHSYHGAVYGPGGISQTLLGQWLCLRQPQISRIETGPPIRDLDTLAYWARVLKIPAELLWFRLPPKDPERPILLMTGRSAPTSWARWPTKQPTKTGPPKP